MSVPSGYVRLQCTRPEFDRTVLLGADAPRVTEGVGGWDTVERPRQTAMTVWGGNPPYQLELPVVFDGHPALSQEPPIRELLAAGRGNEDSEPSPWTIDGIPWLPADQWVLNGAEPGDLMLRRTDDFNRVRQSYTLAFLEYVPPAYAKVRGKALQGHGPTTLYSVKKGDTPASIARRRRINWTVLRQLNSTGSHKITSANQKLTAGWRIRVPILKNPTRRTTAPTR